MNRYDTTFLRTAANNEIAFVPFAVAGDPDIAASESVFKTYIDAGADILEIGYPFSDPIADGPVNQRAAQRAIASGLDPSRFFKLVNNLRRYADVPLGILMYANIAHHIGYASFYKRAAQAGIDSILVADMPPEEAGEMLEAMERHGLGSVFIVSELTPGPRMKYICDAVTGFVYVVSRLGTTGVQSDMDVTVNDTLARLREVTAKPLCVGFGISRPEHVVRVKQAGAQGAIVGSALVKIIEDEAGDKRKMLREIKKRVRAFKEATRGA